MKFRFQSYVDISTSAETMQVIQWSVGGADVLTRCRHLFGAYKYFKLGKISVKMVPASTLPVDPAGLSYESDDPQIVDPRDQMTPGLIRITNGEDIYTDVSSLSDEVQKKVFDSMMLDPRWSKFMLQSGFRRSAYPLYWQVGQFAQDKFPGVLTNVPQYPGYVGAPTEVTTAQMARGATSGNISYPSVAGSSSRGLFQVGHRGKMGFLPTDYYQKILSFDGSSRVPLYGVNNIPEVSVITCVLPKAYKTRYYYRVFITEEVIFAGLKSSPPEDYLGLDQFTFGTVIQTGPGNSMAPVSNSLPNNGGNGF